MTSVTPHSSAYLRAASSSAICRRAARLERVIELGPKRQTLMIGEVVHIDVDPAVMTDGYIDTRKLDPVGRLNGFFYATLGDILERPFNDGSAR
jgi:flavin reductase (DIM6/NTAB) family NADH-FMN oxidoreductase RutF